MKGDARLTRRPHDEIARIQALVEGYRPGRHLIRPERNFVRSERSCDDDRHLAPFQNARRLTTVVRRSASRRTFSLQCLWNEASCHRPWGGSESQMSHPFSMQTAPNRILPQLRRTAPLVHIVTYSPLCLPLPCFWWQGHRRGPRNAWSGAGLRSPLGETRTPLLRSGQRALTLAGRGACDHPAR